MDSDDRKQETVAMSAIGPKQTWAIAPHMSAFGGKADMVIAQRPAAKIFDGTHSIQFVIQSVGLKQRRNDLDDSHPQSGRNSSTGSAARPIFMLALRPLPRVDGIRALRR